MPYINGAKGWPLTNVLDGDYEKVIGRQVWPKISIITPSYNQGRYLEKTIRSVLLQGYPNLEYLVVDGGSNDKSVEIIKKYEPWIDYWISEKDSGQSHAINKGIEKSSGDLLGWLNSDDYLLQGALFKVAREYLNDVSVGAIYGHGHLVDKKGKVLYSPKHVNVTREGLFAWCFGNDFMQPSCFFTRSAWKECGPLDETLNFVLDVEYWIRIASKFNFKRIPDVLSISLSHEKAKTTSMRNSSHAELSIVCMRHGKEAQARRILEHIIEKYKDGGCRQNKSFLNRFLCLVADKKSLKV